MQLDNSDGFWDWYRKAFVGVLTFLGCFAVFILVVAFFVPLIAMLSAK